MCHLTCVLHGISLICEKIRSVFDDVNDLVANVKKVFIKAPLRVRLFKDLCPDVPLPPEPVVTRWGTWLSAAIYYESYLDSIKLVIDNMDDEGAASIIRAKRAIALPNTKFSLNIIKSHFGFLTDILKKLQAGQMKLNDSLELLQIVEDKVNLLENPLLKVVKDKMNNVLRKNVGLAKVREIMQAIKGGQIVDGYTYEEVLAFTFAPVTSVDVERSFSMYKGFSRDNRPFDGENKSMYFMLYFNNNIN